MRASIDSRAVHSETGEASEALDMNQFCVLTTNNPAKTFDCNKYDVVTVDGYCRMKPYQLVESIQLNSSNNCATDESATHHELAIS